MIFSVVIGWVKIFLDVLILYIVLLFAVVIMSSLLSLLYGINGARIYSIVVSFIFLVRLPASSNDCDLRFGLRATLTQDAPLPFFVLTPLSVVLFLPD